MIFAIGSSFAQNGKLDFNKVDFNGLKFRSAKEQIVKKLGKPSRVFEPNYECGFVSSQEQSTRYYMMEYSKVSFIGNPKENYIIDRVKFDAATNATLTYGRWKLNHTTSTKDLVSVFGPSVEFDKQSNGTSITLIRESEDGLVFVFKNQKLVEIHYWSPC